MSLTLQDIFGQSNRIYEEGLSQYACRQNQAYRLKSEPENRLRSDFAVDRDRILYSGAYRRYQGKTQVFSFTNMIDEEMTNRSLHTTYVSQIARSIGKVLRLNLELIEAIALGHDLGHTPFGHEGERALDLCCKKHSIGRFKHNVSSLYIVDHITKRGEGLNLTFQVRDGIVSHDGETHNKLLKPDREKNEQDIKDYIQSVNQGFNSGRFERSPVIEDHSKNSQCLPATLEGCLVRVSDTIAYIGQDIEDAIRFNILKREQLPPPCVEFFGNTNSEIIHKLITDVITHSYERDYISLGEESSQMLYILKDFNYKEIYSNPKIKAYQKRIFFAMDLLFDKYLDDIRLDKRESKFFKHFLCHKSDRYLDNFSDQEKARDFIATMTDRYFNEEIKDYLIPWKY